MASNLYGIDLGSDSIKIYNSAENKLLVEKNYIAVRKKKNVVAVGDAAYELYEKVSDDVKIINPVRGGVIADIDWMVHVFETKLKEMKCSNGFIKSNSFYISVPTSITEVEKRAFFNLVKYSNFRTRHTYIIDKPVAAALGLGAHVKAEKGMMIVDIGCDTTEISIIAMGGVVFSKLLKIGGKTIDETICTKVKASRNLIIGMKTAERLKTQIGNALPGTLEKMTVYGIDLISGLPISAVIDSRIVYDSIKDTINEIINESLKLFERTPPEIHASIKENGIYLTGGGSLIRNTKQVFEKKMGYKINVTEKPAESVITGLDIVMKDPSLKDLLFSVNDAAIE